ncbi:MAG: hypothetical protein AAF194_01730 [Pseudomonadota bacterium]
MSVSAGLPSLSQNQPWMDSEPVASDLCKHYLSIYLLPPITASQLVRAVAIFAMFALLLNGSV